jgi:excisionase family DNA binding protein
MSSQVNLEESYNLFFKDYPDVLNTKQLSEILGVCEKTALSLLNRQEIGSFKIGRPYRIPKLYLLQYLGIVHPENPR